MSYVGLHGTTVWQHGTEVKEQAPPHAAAQGGTGHNHPSLKSVSRARRPAHAAPELRAHEAAHPPEMRTRSGAPRTRPRDVGFSFTVLGLSWKQLRQCGGGTPTQRPRSRARTATARQPRRHVTGFWGAWRHAPEGPSPFSGTIWGARHLPAALQTSALRLSPLHHRCRLLWKVERCSYAAGSGAA